MVEEGGADVESKDGEYGQTPLSCAAFWGHPEVVKFLVHEGGADVESKGNVWGRTPLGFAAERGHLEIVKFLVEEGGADVEAKDEDGRTALDLARLGLKYSWKEQRCRAVAAWLEKG